MKKSNTLELPFIGIEKISGYSILYHEEGHYSTLFKISNPILEYSGDQRLYYNYHHTFLNILKILGEDYIVQKQDVFFDKKFQGKHSEDFLSQKYFEKFKGRKYKEISTYITVTKKIKRSNFFTYNEKDFDNFLVKIQKVYDVLKDGKFEPEKLNEKEITLLTKKIISFSFKDDRLRLDNLETNFEDIKIRGKCLKTISLIDIDEINFPNKIKPYTHENIGYSFPVDLCSFLSNTPDVETLVYNQVISISNQKSELMGLEKKKKRHSSMPDPANDLAVKDIESALENIASNNDLLVNCHFSVMLFGTKNDVSNASNYLEQSLFKIGIIPGQNSYNQFELYKASIPGNAVFLKEYDLFKVTLEPALCLMYKENRQIDEKSKFQVYFTDRQGIPVAIDTSDLPMQTNRINNRNKFVLGPSGSGKSFFMNHLVRQYMQYDTDVILVDTGHSYSGICSYYGGRYITYSEENPITMNPFKITKEEYNEEKREFIKSLIVLLWKGADGIANQTEDTVITTVVSSYFTAYFESDKTEEYLGFNSFYEYSIDEIKKIKDSEDIEFDVKTYKFILKKFYKGGDYDTILNSDVDSSLFDEKFIVFEIDAIKEHKILFPITTIIIMDVFLQKMRHKNNRKALIIEEAWKAIASPNMAGYIVYLYKTVRKFWGEAVVVTQELEDIISNDIVKNSIISNSDTTILLDQNKFRDNYDAVSELLNLSSVERNKIFTVNQLDNKSNRGRFKEVYIKRGDRGEVYGVEVSLFEYLTYTTEKKEKDAIAIYLKKFSNNYRNALETFVADMQKSKMELSDFVDEVNMLN